MGKRAKLRIHYHRINERDNPRQRAGYWYYVRRFWHMYRVYPDGKERNIGEWHIEALAKKNPGDNILSARFHIGNTGSETPWDGHFLLFGIGLYWGYSRGRRLAEWLTRCTGYKYDSRDWTLRISDNRLWWEIANHSDMCDKHPRNPKKHKKRRKHNTWRSGNWNLSIADKIWGPKRYTYEDLERHQTLIQLPEDNYAVILTLQKVLFGRTKVDKNKHEMSYSIDVDAPRGIPTHVDHSGGYKGDRTYGFGVKVEIDHIRYGEIVWAGQAEKAVLAWVLRERERTGFVKPDPVEEG